MVARQVIDAPPVTPPRYGLLVAAAITTDPELRWGAGISFTPELCAGGHLSGLSCGVPTEERGFTPDTAGVCEIDWDTLLVWSAESASTIGFRARDYEGRARRSLLATESFHLAAELWDGTIRDADGLDNVALADATSDTLTAAAVSPLNALALVEQGLATTLRGRRGMVHMSVQLLTLLANDGSVMKEGNLWLTPMGNIVVADAGYSGNGPWGEADASQQWIIGTSMIGLIMGDVMVPGSFSPEWIDSTTNTVTVYAQRAAVFVWDECAHVAAQVNVGLPILGGS